MGTETLTRLTEEAPALPSIVGPCDAKTIRAFVEPIPREWTPLRALTAVAGEPGTVFLESGGAIDGASEWTLLAFDPVWRLKARSLDALRALWPSTIRWEEPPPVPFATGIAGYLAYDLKDWIERLPARARRESALPDLCLGFYDVVWAWNRRTRESWVVATGLPGPGGTGRESRALARIEVQRERLRAGLGGRARTASGPPHPLDTGARAHPGSRGDTAAPFKEMRIVSNFTRPEYERIVERALEHIAAGDIYQVNLAQRYTATPAPEPLPLYERLRRVAPAPFLAYLRAEEGMVLSSSPERFFRVRGRTIETWPIKGTRPRGDTPEEDRALLEALKASEKDRAENVMIVDLERNDLGRVCRTGSVRVPALWEVSSHSNVHHLVSRVEGTLRENVVPADIIRAMFPGGSITGAPKIRAMEIIDELEPVRRGVYTGAIGYWDVSGDADFNVAIRTIVIERGRASFHVGGGIVADSDPALEYEETLAKASGMMRALQGV